MKATERQIEAFNKERKLLIEKVNIFKQGILFAERWSETDSGKKYWIEDLLEKINSLDLKQIDLEEKEYAVTITNYVKDIEIVFWKEFSKIITPFDVIVSKYERQVYDILIKGELN